MTIRGNKQAMHIELAEHERMSESGSSLLRLIQNNDTCSLDLLVRESIQNSLDAGDGTGDPVCVDFKTGDFRTEDISPFFEGITDSLNRQFPGTRSFISIRDTGTKGLTGPVRYADVRNRNFGNLLKLVYEISKPQDQSGAGGSWGLGKTVYFRIGAGLVIYYSRIRKESAQNEEEYESRLAAALVENEGSEDPLLPRSSGIPRGIAWWGDLDGNDEKHTVPLTNDREIRRILDGFGISPFGNTETGTTIIIPFVEEKRLLEETHPTGADEETFPTIPYWCSNGVGEYLRIAVQRWYAPRLNNSSYDGQYLRVRINGAEISMDNMAPIFRLVQVLYDSTPAAPGNFNGKTVTTKPVELRNVFQKGSARAGYISYIRVDSKDLEMLPPENRLNPYYHINRFSTDTMYNDPIILYTRKPGMVVSYETTGDWTEGIPKAGVNEYIIGMFTANSGNRIAQNEMLLEEYIRRGEKADHMAWEDWSINGKNPQIISRIRKNVRRKIRDDYETPVPVTGERKNLGLGKMLADILMPPTDFSYWDDGQGGLGGSGGTGGSGDNPSSSGSGTGSVRNSHVNLQQTGPASFGPEGTEIPIRILFGKRKEAVLEMCVNTERSTMTEKSWKENVGTPFPISMKSFTLVSITRGKGKKVSSLLNNPVTVTENTNLPGLEIAFDSADSYGPGTTMRITLNEAENTVIEGALTYELHGGVQGSVVLKEGK